MTPLAQMRARIGHHGVRDTSAQDAVVAESRKRWRSRRAMLAGGLAGILLLVGASITRVWLSTSAAVPLDRVRIAIVSRGPFVQDVAADGTVIAAESPTLFAPGPGTVTYQVAAGASVTKGQLLATVSSPGLINEHAREADTLARLNAELSQEKLELERQFVTIHAAGVLARLRLSAAQRELKREEAAWNERVIPERDLMRARDEADTARVERDEALSTTKLEEQTLQLQIKAKQLERDRQELVVADLARRIDELNIRSPLTGVVGNLAVDQKTVVAANSPLLTVVNLSRLEIEFQVPEAYASSLRPNMNAEITYLGDTYPGFVTSISPEVHNNQVTGRVRFAGRAPAGLRQNQRVTLRIITDSRPSVLKTERGPFVDSGGVAYVVKGDIAERRPVRLGARSVSEVEILSGLNVGDRVVVSDLSDFKGAPQVRLTR